MKRNNIPGALDDLGDAQDTTVSAPQSTTEAETQDLLTGKDSILSFPTATQLVVLPSHGVFYPEGHALHDTDSIEIKMMTAKEEDILLNSSYIKNGTVLDKLLSSLIVDKTLSLDSVLATDRDALLIAARVSAYGEKYEADVNCPKCTEVNKISIDLEEVLESEFPEFDELPEGVSITEAKTICIELPRTGATFELRPRLCEDDKKVTMKQKKLKKLKARNSDSLSLVEAFKQITVSVNGETGREFIDKVFEILPAYDFRHLRVSYQDIIPTVNMHTHLECTACGAEEVIVVPMNADFLWPDIKI